MDLPYLNKALNQKRSGNTKKYGQITFKKNALSIK